MGKFKIMSNILSILILFNMNIFESVYSDCIIVKVRARGTVINCMLLNLSYFNDELTSILDKVIKKFKIYLLRNFSFNFSYQNSILLFSKSVFTGPRIQSNKFDRKCNYASDSWLIVKGLV